MFAKKNKVTVNTRFIVWCILSYSILTIISSTVIFGITHHYVHGRVTKTMVHILKDLEEEYVKYNGNTPTFQKCIKEDVDEHNPKKTLISLFSSSGELIFETQKLLHPNNPQYSISGKLNDGSIIVITKDIDSEVDFDYFIGSILALISFLGILLVYIFSRLLGGRILHLNTLVEEKNRAIDELKTLTDDIAHDLRTPLSHLKMAAEASFDKHENIELAERVAHDTESMVEMINTMLEISQTGFHIDRTPREELNLSDLLNRAAELYQPVVEDQSLTLIVDTPDSPLYFSAHKAKIQRIIGNLIDNAIKFTPKDGRITLALQHNTHNLKIIVSDTGCGIPQKDIPFIFRRFYRADASRNLPGNGLGLALVHAIVTSYGGNITCESTLNKGTTFTITFALT